ncbi:hypothetical protein P4133_34670 [Pseudomonas aeruginosa]|nr:hypothetical protein [Pseudomonas aeruginosa]MDF5999837.1 hypothetical protein [Pseudomonas aeruginosa]
MSTSTPALAFQRSYNSTDGLWRHNFSSSLRLTSDSVVTVALHHGRELVFTLSGSNFVPRNPDQGLLEKKETAGNICPLTTSDWSSTTTEDCLGKRPPP